MQATYLQERMSEDHMYHVKPYNTNTKTLNMKTHMPPTTLNMKTHMPPTTLNMKTHMQATYLKGRMNEDHMLAHAHSVPHSCSPCRGDQQHPTSTMHACTTSSMACHLTLMLPPLPPHVHHQESSSAAAGPGRLQVLFDASMGHGGFILKPQWQHTILQAAFGLEAPAAAAPVGAQQAPHPTSPLPALLGHTLSRRHHLLMTPARRRLAMAKLSPAALLHLGRSLGGLPLQACLGTAARLRRWPLPLAWVSVALTQAQRGAAATAITGSVIATQRYISAAHGVAAAALLSGHSQVAQLFGVMAQGAAHDGALGETGGYADVTAWQDAGHSAACTAPLGHSKLLPARQLAVAAAGRDRAVFRGACQPPAYASVHTRLRRGRGDDGCSGIVPLGGGGLVLLPVPVVHVRGVGPCPTVLLGRHLWKGQQARGCVIRGGGVSS